MADTSKNSPDSGQKTANVLERTMGRYSSPFGAATDTFTPVGGKYDVGQMTYPTDLFSPTAEYGGNYAIFYVNVAEDSKLVREGGEPTVDIGANERLRSSINQAGLSTGAIIAGSALLGAASGTILGALGGGGSTAAGGGVAGGVVGAAAAGIVSAAAGGKMSRQQKRLKAAIALNIPNQLNIRYSVQYQEADTGAFQAAAMLGEAGLKAITEVGANSQSTGGPTVGGTAGSVATALALNAPGGIGDGLSAASGLTANPKKEQLFKGVDFRTFVFDYSFAPRDSKEARNVLNIIKMFKLHMHPEFKDQASFIFIYPSEFDIHYYYQGGDNKAIHKHTSCVLTDMNINYTPNGVFNTFSDGTPTQINLQMTFKELAILTKEQIQQGF